MHVWGIQGIGELLYLAVSIGPQGYCLGSHILQESIRNVFPNFLYISVLYTTVVKEIPYIVNYKVESIHMTISYLLASLLISIAEKCPKQAAVQMI